MEARPFSGRRAMMIFLTDSLLCLACFWFARSEAFRRRLGRGALPFYPMLWLLLAFLLALQQATGALDAITNAARGDAMAEGWYGERRPFQWLLIKAVPVIALLVGGGALWIIRRAWRRYLLVVVATLYWAAFAAIRGVSFHNIDWLLQQRSAGLRNETWGDLAGVALTAAALLIARLIDRRQGAVGGRGGHPATQAPPSRFGQLRGAAGRSLRSEGRIMTAWYARYRAHRRRIGAQRGAGRRR